MESLYRFIETMAKLLRKEVRLMRTRKMHVIEEKTSLHHKVELIAVFLRKQTKSTKKKIIQK